MGVFGSVQNIFSRFNLLLNLLVVQGLISEKKKPCSRSNYRAFAGAGNVTRTHDLLITNQLLYRLSYTSISLQRLRF